MHMCLAWLRAAPATMPGFGLYTWQCRQRQHAVKQHRTQPSWACKPQTLRSHQHRVSVEAIGTTRRHARHVFCPLRSGCQQLQMRSSICAAGEGFSVAFDPLDGSSIVDTNFSVGTIFGIWPGDKLKGITGGAAPRAQLQPSYAAGWAPPFPGPQLHAPLALPPKPVPCCPLHTP